MQRMVYSELMRWKDDPDRLPMILEGVRQCGKTYVLNEFGRRNFQSVAYVNFETTPSVAEFFEGDLDPGTVVHHLETKLGMRILPGRTLLILDEIQSAPRALTSIKYFAEMMPELHVACAGSLLGLLTSKPDSYPVGKVDHVTMHPMNLMEFLLANGEGALVRYLAGMGRDEDVPRTFHDTLVRYLREYYLVGGMPRAVQSWITHRSIAAVTRILNGIVRDYENDMSKHAGNDLQKVTSVWDSIPVQLARENRKFVFSHARSGSRAKDLEDALAWLVDAGLVHRVCCVEAPASPLKGVSDRACFKLYLCDVGILRVMSGRTRESMGGDAHATRLFNGAMAENLVLCEMVSCGADEVFYWRRGNHEVDFLIDGDRGAVPVEVKSEENTRAGSLSRYIDDNRPEDVFLASMRRDGGGRLGHIPLYRAWMIPHYCGAPMPAVPGDPDPAGASGEFRRDFTEADWSGTGGRMVLRIGRGEHGVRDPVSVRVFRGDGNVRREVAVPVIMDLDGNVVIESDAAFPGFVSIA